jgi:hypothetical protein
MTYADMTVVVVVVRVRLGHATRPSRLRKKSYLPNDMHQTGIILYDQFTSFKENVKERNGRSKKHVFQIYMGCKS